MPTGFELHVSTSKPWYYMKFDTQKDTVNLTVFRAIDNYLHG